MTIRPLILVAVTSLVAFHAPGDVISYLRFEEGSGFYASDETGLMNGALLGSWPSFEPGGGDIGPAGWSTNVHGSTVPLTGAANTGSINFGEGWGFVNLSNPNHVDLGTEFTIELFFRAEGVSRGFRPMFGFAPVSRLFGSLYVSEHGDLSFGTQFQNSINPDNAFG